LAQYQRLKPYFHYRCALKRFEARWSASTRSSYRWLSLAMQRNAQP